MIRSFNEPEYLELEAIRLDGSPLMITHGNQRFQVIQRPIRGTSHSDGVSVYGYPELGSPRIGGGNDSFAQTVEHLRAAARSAGLASIFYRIGLSQDLTGHIDPTYACLQKVGDVVVINLKQSPEQIFQSFRKQIRYELRNSEPLKITTSDDVDDFYDIYTENMTRLNASETYFFSREYLSRLIAMNGTNLFVAKENEALIGAAITVKHGNSLYYHLGATAGFALHRSPIKSIIWSICQVYAHSGIEHLVLGGGLGGRDDNLMRFKKGFSKLTMESFSLKLISDVDLYRSLSGMVAEEPISFEGFFPRYRDPSFPSGSRRYA